MALEQINISKVLVSLKAIYSATGYFFTEWWLVPIETSRQKKEKATVDVIGANDKHSQLNRFVYQPASCLSSTRTILRLRRKKLTASFTSWTDCNGEGRKIG